MNAYGSATNVDASFHVIAVLLSAMFKFLLFSGAASRIDCSCIVQIIHAFAELPVTI
jgi:hypothetical protein